MSRNLGAWVLITLGLTGIVGGAGMVYIFSIANQPAPANARTLDAAPSPLLKYGSPALSAVVGLVFLCWGLGMRGSWPRVKSGSGKGSKRTCPNCGHLRPVTAVKCYHCGSSL